LEKQFFRRAALRMNKDLPFISGSTDPLKGTCRRPLPQRGCQSAASAIARGLSVAAGMMALKAGNGASAAPNTRRGGWRA